MSAGVSSDVRFAPYAAVAVFLMTAATGQAARVSVELIPSVTAVEPGGKLTIAAVFTIEKDWHLYWINPGETGTPPDIKWTTPAGVTVGPAHFPTPHTINSSGLTAYGYEKTLTLLYDVAVPKDATGDVELKADANWIVCSDACEAEGQKTSVKVPVAAQRGQDNELAKFEIWRSQQPKRLDQPVIAAVEADGKHGTIEMNIPTGSTFAEFFPPQADFAEWEKPTVVGDKVRVRFRVLPSPPATHTADAVAVFTGDKDGKSAVSQPVQFKFQSPHKE